MKTSLLSILFVAACASLCLADNASIAGKWQVHSSIAGNESDLACSFDQKDDVLTGTCTGEQGDVKINGKIDGKKITWSYKSEYQGQPLTVNYEGTLDASSKIQGSVDVPEFSVGGDFTATQSK